MRRAPPGAALRRLLLTLVLAATGCEAGESPAPQGSPAGLPDGVGSVDLLARIAELERSHPDSPDRSLSYFQSPAASVHLHVMGRGQMTPLHIHRTQEEVAVVVAGEARVHHACGGKRRTGDYGPGWLLHAPPLCGHEWVNRDASASLASLVFSVPGFDGNLYVRPDDARLAEGGEPAEVDAREALRSFAASGAAPPPRPLPGMRGALSLLLLRGRHVVDPEPGRPRIAYVLAGQVEVVGRDVAGTGLLLLLNASEPVELRTGEEPAALLLFEPAAT